MTRRLVLHITLVVMTSLVLLSCGREERQKAIIIEQGVQIKLADFVARRNQICEDEAVQKAMVIADSIIREEGLRSRIEPIDKPPVASRPPKPAIRTLPDSLKMDKLRQN